MYTFIMRPYISFNANCDVSSAENLRKEENLSGSSSVTKKYTVYACLAPGANIWSVLDQDGINIASAEFPGPYLDVHEPAASFSSRRYSVDEGSATDITVNLSHMSGNIILVPIEVSSSTAESEAYSVTGLVRVPGVVNGYLRFYANETSKSFNIMANEDDDFTNETVNLTLDMLTGFVDAGTPSSATLTIRDDGSPPPRRTPTPTPTPTPIPTPPDPPTNVMGTANEGEIELAWGAGDGADAYDVYQWSGDPAGPPTQGSWLLLPSGPYTINGSLTTVTITATTATIGGLTTGSTYFHRVTSKNAVGVSHSTPAETILPLTTPADLNVTPFPLRRAKLSWQGDSGADRFEVYAKDPTVAPPADPWKLVATVTDASAGHTINLDNVVNGEGLAKQTEFKLRVKAKRASNAQLDSHDSELVTIRDTPILSINGDSASNGAGQAVVKWAKVQDAQKYVVRWRRMRSFDRHPHTDYRWRPQPVENAQRWTESDPLSSGAREYTISGLLKSEVYAVQLKFSRNTAPGSPVPTEEGFAAREFYVWPSDRPAGNGERVATFPLKYPWPNKTYSYVICEDTFPSGKRDEWKTFITHAISQWDLATDGLVTTDRLDTETCANYSEFVEEVVTQVKGFAQSLRPPAGIPPTDAEIAAHANALLGNFGQSRIETTRKLDERLNEVLLVDDISTNIKVGVFQEISMRVGHGWCPNNAIACAAPSVTPVLTVDIRLMASKFQRINLNVSGNDDIADAREIPFNSCRMVHRRYGTLVHEAGHALGITGGITGTGQGRGHPHIEDSVMSYSRDRSVSCSPTQFDVMAIYALYQSR